MICNARTCTECRYLKDDERQDDQTSFAEFLANCQHAKCKVVRLVRQQISKLQNMQSFPNTNGEHEPHEETYSEIYGKVHEKVHQGEVYEAQDEVQVRGRTQRVYEYSDTIASYGISRESGGPQVDAVGLEPRSSSGSFDVSGGCGRCDSLVCSGVRSLLLVVP
ncbi:hypothetical protein EAI_07260 [Harpegnathos saltator]|uniref:Uncharacterized protein n=1 Tax=Harpegnathos saltator TaxID=610380 RepID=E2BN55_HARSA|nr:hypothetical protein EAI_07260 [Harpegnathos saltator]